MTLNKDGERVLNGPLALIGLIGSGTGIRYTDEAPRVRKLQGGAVAWNPEEYNLSPLSAETCPPMRDGVLDARWSVFG